MKHGELLIADITRDPRCQPRQTLDLDTIIDYADAMRSGSTFPPVTVFVGGGNHWLADGFHRVAAAERAGLDTIGAHIHNGDLRSAILHGVGANATHGLRRSNADKRRAVAALVGDDEWSAWSDREIARQCGVTHPFVARLRREHLGGNGYHSTADISMADIQKMQQLQQGHVNKKVVPAVAMKEAGFEDDRILAALAITDPEHRRDFSSILAHFGGEETTA